MRRVVLVLGLVWGLGVVQVSSEYIQVILSSMSDRHSLQEYILTETVSCLLHLTT